MARESYRKQANAFKWILAVLGLAMLIIWLSLPRLTNWPELAREAIQRTQFRAVSLALELFEYDFDAYPPSDANDSTGKPYCGAMKLLEAMFGRDMLGFHRNSAFRADGKDANGVAELYDPTGDHTARIEPYWESKHVDSLAQIYGPGNTGPFEPNLRVLCDVFNQMLKSRRKVGMPVLYYKADTSKTAHDVNNPDNPNNIYNYRDNHALLALGVPGEPEKEHPLFTDPRLFYKMTKSDKVTTASKPVNADTFILISAGKDGLYGTKDDICNFDYTFPE